MTEYIKKHYVNNDIRNDIFIEDCYRFTSCNELRNWTIEDVEMMVTWFK